MNALGYLRARRTSPNSPRSPSEARIQVPGSGTGAKLATVETPPLISDANEGGKCCRIGWTTSIRLELAWCNQSGAAARGLDEVETDDVGSDRSTCEGGTPGGQDRN